MSSALGGALPSASSPVSPNKNAFRSRLALLDGRFLCCVGRGADGEGLQDGGLQDAVSSGSSIHENDDCASVERVGMGAAGRSAAAAWPGASPPLLTSTTVGVEPGDYIVSSLFRDGGLPSERLAFRSSASTAWLVPVWTAGASVPSEPSPSARRRQPPPPWRGSWAPLWTHRPGRPAQTGSWQPQSR